MPFKSEAQRRLFYAKAKQGEIPEETVRHWESETKGKLPERVKKAEDAMSGEFFNKRAQAEKGRFFRDLPGREKGDFHKKGMLGAGAPDAAAPVTASPQMAALGAAGGNNSTGSMYGGGDGEAVDKVKELLDYEMKEHGKIPTPKEEEAEKKALELTPDVMGGGLVIPTGFERPTSEQPEALEAGGERFHDSEARIADFGTGKGVPKHGLVETGGMKVSATSGHQMGKHAAARFLGTTMAKTAAAVDVDKHKPGLRGDDGSALDKAIFTAKSPQYSYGVVKKDSERTMKALKDGASSATSSAGKAIASVGKRIGNVAKEQMEGGTLQGPGVDAKKTLKFVEKGKKMRKELRKDLGVDERPFGEKLTRVPGKLYEAIKKTEPKGTAERAYDKIKETVGDHRDAVGVGALGLLGMALMRRGRGLPKHAAPTDSWEEAGEAAKDIGRKAVGEMDRLSHEAKDYADKGVNYLREHPGAALAVTGLAGLKGLSMAKGIGRGALGLLRRRPKPPTGVMGRFGRFFR